MTGSRRLMLPDDMSILARRVFEPSSNSPWRMRSKRPRFSATLRLRYGLGRKARDDTPEAPGLAVLDDRVTDEVGGLRRVAHRFDGITTPSRPAATAGVISLTTTPVSSVSSGRHRR